MMPTRQQDLKRKLCGKVNTPPEKLILDYANATGSVTP